MKTHPYRISEAAVGRMFAEVIRMTRSSEITGEQFHDTVFAVFNYIESEKEPATAAKINPLVWKQLKANVDKSARRSAAARIGAAKRKEKKHSLISGAAKPVSDLLAAQANCNRVPAEITVHTASVARDYEAATAVKPMDTRNLKEILPFLTPENQKEFLRMEQEKFDYAKEQERIRKEEAIEQERKRIEDEKAAEKKRKEDLERKRREMDAFVSWQLAGRPPTNHRFDIF